MYKNTSYIIQRSYILNQIVASFNTLNVVLTNSVQNHKPQKYKAGAEQTRTTNMLEVGLGALKK